MRNRATIKAVYALCDKALGGKIVGEYSADELRLNFQRSTLKNCWESYEDYKVSQAEVLTWATEFEKGGDCYGKIIADTWRWCYGMNKKLPVRILRQR